MIAAEGNGTTVTVALPLEVPLPYGFVRAVTVYVVVTAGLTLRVTGLVVTPVCTTPSDHVTSHGAIPVSAAWIVFHVPEQTVPLPPTTAVGAAEASSDTVVMFVETPSLAVSLKT